MPIEPPNLDDLRYDRVREDLIRRIPVHAPEWTDHNESDPGVTLIELFAFLAEQVGYRLNLIPEKNHIELLKLFGVRLRTARAARTQLALLLSDPATATSVVLAEASRAKAKKGNPPPVFETAAAIDIAPVQPTVLVTTISPFLWDLLQGGQLPANATPPPSPSPQSQWHTVVWDGKTPKLKDMPLGPLVLFPQANQQYLWIGLDFNPALDAGFLGVRVTLTIQFDDDEQPDLRGGEHCVAAVASGSAPAPVDWLAYFDSATGRMARVPGRVDDGTDKLTHSGALRFTVPFTMGSIPPGMFRNLRDPVTLTPAQTCQSLSSNLRTHIGNIQFVVGSEAKYLADLQGALTTSVTGASGATSPQPAVLHPLDPKLRDPGKMKGWLRIGPISLPQGAASPKLRIAVFNAVPVINGTTVTQELLGTSNGRPGQIFQLANRPALSGSLKIEVQEERDALTPWSVVDSLDASGPFDRHAEVDYEAGSLKFGDGRRGRIPPLVLAGGNIVAVRYQHGGGKAGEVDVGAIASLETQAAGLSGCVNFVKGVGGADAETLEEAKIRARKELSTRSRAVTASDFEWIARQTPTVRVARVATAPLRRPLQSGSFPPPSTVRCGSIPQGLAGLDDGVRALGAVSVVVVPDEEGPEPVPTPSFLRAVCAHLNQHRLITTEVYVVPPQYMRICRFRVNVKARPGYTRTQLQNLVEQRLTTYLHVLKGGEDGKGYPFGGQVHVADLMAVVFRVEGVERVESVFAEFTRTKSNANPRQGRLLLCPQAQDDFSSITMAPEECVSIDASDFTLTTVV